MLLKYHLTTIMNDPQQQWACMILVPLIRKASRDLVREFGFMNDTIAGSGMSPSAVHTLVELGEREITTASNLCHSLNLEKSSVSRLLKKLIEAGDIAERQSPADGREKVLSLTTDGKTKLAEINNFADTQVIGALKEFPHDKCNTILQGLRTYADALRATRLDQNPHPKVTVVRGYQPGLLATTMAMHMEYYSRTSGFGKSFEIFMASDLADLFARIEHENNGAWATMSDGRIVGTIFIDGQAPGENKAHLRAFIVDEAVRGMGVGRTLLGHAMAFVDERQFVETQLWTFKGLDAARKLYEWAGFVLAWEKLSKKWGEEVTVQHFVRSQDTLI
jgi:DNA-binding MarR family transcriptional regulator/GNAT superfamily N-acetyltransferase